MIVGAGRVDELAFELNADAGNRSVTGHRWQARTAGALGVVVIGGASCADEIKLELFANAGRRSGLVNGGNLPAEVPRDRRKYQGVLFGNQQRVCHVLFSNWKA